MGWWMVMLRGIGHRVGRSMLVLIMATVATASAVASLAYSRSAQESVLTDVVRHAPSYRTDIVISAAHEDYYPSEALPDLDATEFALSQAYHQFPVLAKSVAVAIAAEDTDVTVLSDKQGIATLGYRAGVCANLTIIGACPTDEGQVLVSQRTADQAGIKVGQTLTLQLDENKTEFTTRQPGTRFNPPPTASATADERMLTVQVVGVYTPKDPEAGYWYGNAYFVFGSDASSPTGMRFDAIFTGSEYDVRHDPASQIRLHLEIPLAPRGIDVGDVPALRMELVQLATFLGSQNLVVSTGLTLLLEDVTTQEQSLSSTIPVAAVPLVVLALFVLFLLVAALGEERAPELGLAKLRGYSGGRAGRFAAAEMVLLILVAGPLGFLVGLAGALLAVKLLFAPGTGVQLSWQLYAAAAGVVLVGLLAAWFAGRSRLRQGVLDLIRRVPARGRRTASLALALTVAVVVGSLVAAYLDPSSPITWLAAPSIAVIAGLVASRALTATAVRRLRGAARRGRIVGLLAGAWVARQPGRGRVVAVLTTSVALVVFGAIGWGVATQARHDSGADTLGADRVYDVVAPYPDVLVAGVRAADPSGNSMPVVWTSTYYADQQVPLYAVDSTELARVGLWRGESASQVAALAAKLRPKTAPPLSVTGQLSATADVTKAPPNTFMLEALIEHPGAPPLPFPLGILHEGTDTYSATVDGCAAGCRFLGLVVSRLRSGAFGDVNLVMQITGVNGPGIAVSDFSDPVYWGAVKPRADSTTLVVTPGNALGVHLDTMTIEDETVAYRDTPDALPVVVSGGSKSTDPNAPTFSFPGLDSGLIAMTAVGRAARVPAGGTDAVLADINVASAMAERRGTLAGNFALAYEVWADADAPADLTNRLADQGIAVQSEDTVENYVAGMARSAPTLSFWFYLIAGVIAFLLAIGVVLLGTYVGAEARVYAYAALRVAGVPPRQLRASLRREYRSVLGTSLIVGALAGALGAALMLPNIPLVTAGGPHGDVPYGANMIALYVALGAIIVAMAVIVMLALRVIRRATPERLREGVR